MTAVVAQDSVRVMSATQTPTVKMPCCCGVPVSTALVPLVIIDIPNGGSPPADNVDTKLYGDVPPVAVAITGFPQATSAWQIAGNIVITGPERTVVIVSLTVAEAGGLAESVTTTVKGTEIVLVVPEARIAPRPLMMQVSGTKAYP